MSLSSKGLPSPPTTQLEAAEPDALTYWQGMLAKARNKFEENRAAGMIELIEKGLARARGEVVKVRRRNYGYGYRSAR